MPQEDIFKQFTSELHDLEREHEHAMAPLKKQRREVVRECSHELEAKEVLRMQKSVHERV